jgi:Tfp pilus assembly protein PilF
MHPQFYYNNLGILHLRLRKFKMATLYFSKSLKFLEQSQTTTPNIPQTSEKAVPLPWGESFI